MSRRDKKRIHRPLNRPCQAEGPRQGEILLVLFDRIRGLPGNTASLRQFLLGKTPPSIHTYIHPFLLFGYFPNVKNL